MTVKRFKIPKTAEAAAWLTTSLDSPKDSGTGILTLAELFPKPFAAYARVFHPADQNDVMVLNPGEVRVEQPVRWQTVAEASNTKAHRLMQWPNIAKVDVHAVQPTQVDAPWRRTPMEGHLSSEIAAVLAGILRQFTATPETCWFAVWEGHGFDDEPWMQAAPSVAIDGMGYRLFTGPVEVATESFYYPGSLYSATMWWPDDRAWLVVTDIDLPYTYIGGSKAAIEAVLGERQLEAFRAFIDDDITLSSDSINPAD